MPVQIVLAVTMWVVGGRVQGWIDAVRWNGDWLLSETKDILD